MGLLLISVPIILILAAFTLPIPLSYAQSNDVNMSTSNLTTGNWTSYTNSTLGISFDYPFDWEVTEKQGRFEKGPDVIVTDGQIAFKIIKIDESINDIFQRHWLTETVKQFENQYQNDEGTRIIESTDMKKYKIDGERTGTFLYMANNEDGTSMAQENFLTQHRDRVYFLIFGDSTLTFDSPETQSIMQKIIKSFKFIT
jgi:hypothetical protein